MGQKLSALKRIRKASKQAQYPSTLNEPTNEFLEWEDDYAVSSSEIIESTRFNSIDTPSEVLLTVPELEAETAPTTLPNLCTELILDIAGYLSPSSYISLSYSCRTMRNKMGISFTETLGDGDPKGGLSGSTLSIESRNVRYLERLELWSMLVRDGKIPRWKASFRGDQREIIDDSLVRTPSYAPLSTEHRCLGTTGMLWVCPHRILSYNDATTERETDDTHTCGSSYIATSGCIVTIWTIMRIPANSVPTRKEVVEALRPLDAPICPHLRLNDASVARIYDPRCQRLRSNKDWYYPALACRCSICLSGEVVPVVCSYCDTSVVFDISHNPPRRAKLLLLIMRTLRFGRSCTDRDWIAQVARPTDFEEYERVWEATNAECSRRGFDDLYD